jgi:hypothetical protein
MDYKEVSLNGQYVFVMLGILPTPADDPAWRYEEPRVRKDAEIRRVYPQSGLYRNDGSAAPLWTVDWYAFKVFVASDGVHLVRLGN